MVKIRQAMTKSLLYHQIQNSTDWRKQKSFLTRKGCKKGKEGRGFMKGEKKLLKPNISLTTGGEKRKKCSSCRRRGIGANGAQGGEDGGGRRGPPKNGCVVAKGRGGLPRKKKTTGLKREKVRKQDFMGDWGGTSSRRKGGKGGGVTQCSKCCGWIGERNTPPPTKVIVGRGRRRCVGSSARGK